MKSGWLGLCFCLVLLQSCSQQKTEQTKTDDPNAGNSKASEMHDTPVPVDMNKKEKPKSQQFFEQAQQSLRENKAKEGFDLMEKAVSAANDEKAPQVALFCREQEAQLKFSMKDQPGAIKVLETTLKEYDVPNSPPNCLATLDNLKTHLASLYAANGKNDQAEAIYNEGLASAKKGTPSNHQRTAFWLSNFSQYYQFRKDAKKSKTYADEMAAELKKK